jgi:hypothetical protein
VRLLSLPLLLLAVPLAALLALSGEAEEEAPFRLGGPEVAKLDWNVRSLVAKDLDGDGLIDMAVLNNDRARIEILFQGKPGEAKEPKPAASHGRWEPVLEDARYRKVSVVTGIGMFALAAADLDGDGLADLAYTGKPDALTVRYQGKGNDWSRKRVFDLSSPMQWISTVKAADLNGDGRQDLVVLTQKELLVFTQGDKGDLAGPERYALADEGCYGLQVSDVDGDGRADLLVIAPNKRDGLRVRFRTAQKEGGFGPERPFRIESPRGLISPLKPGGTGGLPSFVQVQAQTGLVECLTLASEPGNALPTATLQPRIFSTRAGGKVPSAYALADLNGDTRLDIAVADAEGAQVLLYLRQADGEFQEPQRFPSLAEVRGIAAGDMDGDGRAELVVASLKEKTLGISRFSPEGRLGYPQPLPTTGKPLAVAAADLDGDGDLDIAYPYEEGGKRSVGILTQDAGVWKAGSVELAGLKTDPKGLKILDANQDGRPDLALFTIQEPMRLLLQNPEGGFREEAGFRKGLVDNLDPSALTMGDVDGDGKPEMLVAGVGYARSLRMNAQGALEVVDQYNARESDAEIALALSVDLDGDQALEMLLAARKGEDLQVLRRDAKGVYRFDRSLPTGKIDLVGAEARQLDGKPELLLFGKDRFWWMPVGRGDLAVRSLGTTETDLPDVAYADVTVGDLNGDGREDIVGVDSGEGHLLEILSRDAGGAWHGAFHFALFEADPHYQGRKGSNQEPREVLIADVTGDGRQDLVLLIHDRLLVYPQE